MADKTLEDEWQHSQVAPDLFVWKRDSDGAVKVVVPESRWMSFDEARGLADAIKQAVYQ